MVKVVGNIVYIFNRRSVVFKKLIMFWGAFKKNSSFMLFVLLNAFLVWLNYEHPELFEVKLSLCIKIDLALNNRQWLMCHKTKPNETSLLVISTFVGYFMPNPIFEAEQ